MVVDLVPLALRTDTLDWVVANYAATFSVGKDLIDAAAGDTEVSTFSEAVRAPAGLRYRVISGVARTGRAGSADVEGVSGTITACLNNVVDFVGVTRDTADGKGSIKELALGTLDAFSTNLVEADLADAALVHKVLVFSTRI